MWYINCVSMKLEKECLRSKWECSYPLPLKHSQPSVALGLSQGCSCTAQIGTSAHVVPSPWASSAALSLLGAGRVLVGCWALLGCIAVRASLELLPHSPVVQMLLPLRPASVTGDPEVWPSQVRILTLREVQRHPPTPLMTEPPLWLILRFLPSILRGSPS